MKLQTCMGVHKMKRAVVSACLIVLLACGVNPAIHIYASSKTEKKAETEVLGYIGKVIGGVNVRVGAGEKNDKVMHNGEGVHLDEGEEVLIIGEEMVGKKPWYQIKITLDGEEITGFATSTYIEKTKKAVTPSPTPTPEPTATPTPKPMATPTPEPTIVVKNETNVDGGSGNGTLKVIGFAAVTLIVISGVVYAVIKRSKMNNDVPSTELSKKVEQLKKIKIENSKEQDKPVAVMKRRPEIKTSDKIQDNHKNERKPDVYVKSSERANAEFAAASEAVLTKESVELKNEDLKLPGNVSPEEVKENVIKDNEEKRILRAQIEALREHDIVIHKYFGRGEVFDNSDVKLIEVRFGGDVRFMNKESLVAKKLLTITNERKR